MTEPRTDPPLGAELRAGPSPGTSPAASRAAATPPSTPHPGGLVEAAARLARSAAEGAGVVIDEVHELDQLHDITRVIEAVWHRPGDAIAVDLLRALAHSGNCVLAAWSGTEMVGASVAFRGLHDGRPSLHSHITGIVPDLQLHGAGHALKLRQRAWALANGIDVVTWTFDPLIARNGHFNLTKLGAEADEYLEDFYGSLSDLVNREDATDRLLAVWRLASPRVARALSGEVRVPSIEALREDGDPVVLDIGADGRPVAAEVIVGTRSGRALVHIPADIVAVRGGDPGCAGAWRRALREAMTALFTGGLRPLAAVAPGWYVFGPAGSDWPR
jgi:predicted GNAT superfamily acetyltransferase